MSTLQQPPRLNALAILSLVSAFFLSLMAVITGHIALSQIRRTGERGREFAVAGIVIGYIGLAAGLLTTLVVILAIVIAAASGGFWHRNVIVGPVPDARGPGSTEVPSPSADPYAPAAPSDITFDAGTSLSSGTVPHISDGLLGDSLWKLTTPKADGTWVYTSTDGRCTTTFHEGALDAGLDVTKGDDLATTDSYLAALTSSSASDVADFADDDYITLDQPEDNAIVETRRLAGNDSGGRPHVAVARAFAALEQGVSINIACDTKALAIDAYDHVLSKTALLVG
ncbi:hypothetical protein B7R54_16490 [Subtercola boreus]|uniref:DUF4190 domain-containing protein n=1 Tax=Subtercola boreus TaxID=120213 RepID=A0A3E0VPI4_9MICO|nr:DUF4190 domain-containing protein [Subtercola boreus]RFA11348.1 hypothetical protein B7R54_16490 [Subtercola boreus]TQL55823.1 uncharacterized protein DUF4190 [Subtercola boreus]